MKSIFIFILFMLNISSVSMAGILLDPYLSFIVSSTNRDSDSKFSGTILGSRIGWGMMGFAFGLDAALTGNISGKSGSTTTEIKPSGVGIFAAYSFPIFVRGYLSYFPSYILKMPSIESSGTNTKIGVQYTGLPFVALGLESETFTLKKLNSTNADNIITFTNLSVSVPFDI